MNDEVFYFLKILEIILIAAVKFLIAPFEAERYGFNFRDAFLITTTGGTLGILTFTFIGEIIALGWKKLIHLFKKPLHVKEKPKKKFTWTRRFIIRIKMRFGLLGLLLATPSVISIPIGTFMVHRFYKKRWKNILLLMVSVVAWALILNGIAQYLKLSRYIPEIPE